MREEKRDDFNGKRMDRGDRGYPGIRTFYYESESGKQPQCFPNLFNAETFHETILDADVSFFTFSQADKESDSYLLVDILQYFNWVLISLEATVNSRSLNNYIANSRLLT